MTRKPASKLPRLAVRPINRKHGLLPKTVAGRRIVLFSCNEIGKVIATQLYMPEATSTIDAPGFSHYAVLPGFLHKA